MCDAILNSTILTFLPLKRTHPEVITLVIYLTIFVAKSPSSLIEFSLRISKIKNGKVVVGLTKPAKNLGKIKTDVVAVLSSPMINGKCVGMLGWLDLF